MEIPPCTEGKHSTTDLPPQIEKRGPADPAQLQPEAERAAPSPPRAPISVPQSAPTPPPPESDDDDPALVIPDGRMCRRRGCGVAYKTGQAREDEKCVHHPGAPIFHEGSKGYSCCKRRVLEFDQFMKIEGCKTKDRHLFVGSGKKDVAGKSGVAVGEGGEEMVETVRCVARSKHTAVPPLSGLAMTYHPSGSTNRFDRHDFYQTPTSVIASFFLKKINKDVAKVEFQPQQLVLDLPTTDTPVKRHKAEVPLFAPIDPAKSAYKILGTKLEVTLAKADGSSWPVLRSDDRLTGQILQIGRAGRAQ